MTKHEISRSAIDALFVHPALYPRLANAVRLYVHLARLATPWGLIIRSRKRLAGDIGVSENAIDRWVKRLAETHLVHVQVPSPFLVIRMRFWSASVDSRVKESTPAGPEASTRENAPGSSELQQAAAASKSSGVGGLGEGVPLSADVRAVLGDADATEVAALVDQYPEYIVRKALRRVELTPASQIRKSKLALFRYLLALFNE
jgi:transposase-like protein